MISQTNDRLARPHSHDPLAYSIADACRVTSIGRTRIYQLIGEGRLETRKIGNRTIIPAASLRALVDGEA